MRFENAYTWLVFVSALDIMLTALVLYRGGYEANALAAAVINRFDLPGMIAYKFCLVAVVIMICEAIARWNVAAGRRFVVAAVIISAYPVAVGFGLLLG